MISLSSEMTDSKGRRARRGWLFFDADCAFCTALARRFRGVLEARGYRLAPLQDPRVPAILSLPPHQLLSEMRLLTADGAQFGGADAFIFLARQIWWAWPVYAFAQMPGVRTLLRGGYRWVAANRHCSSGACPRTFGAQSAASAAGETRRPSAREESPKGGNRPWVL